MAVAESVDIAYGLFGDYEDWQSDPFYGSYLGRRRQKSYNIVCKHCGTGGLHWGSVNGNWRLFDDEAQHSCHFGYKAAFSKKTVDSDPSLSYNAYLDTIPWETPDEFARRSATKTSRTST